MEHMSWLNSEKLGKELFQLLKVLQAFNKQQGLTI